MFDPLQAYSEIVESLVDAQMAGVDVSDLSGGICLSDPEAVFTNRLGAIRNRLGASYTNGPRPSMSATRPAPPASDLSAARDLWNRYKAMEGYAKTEFLANNEAALMKAAEIVTLADEGKEEAPSSEQAAARKLWDQYQALTGYEQTKFAEDNAEALQSAAQVLSASKH